MMLPSEIEKIEFYVPDVNGVSRYVTLHYFTSNHIICDAVISEYMLRQFIVDDDLITAVYYDYGSDDIFNYKFKLSDWLDVCMQYNVPLIIANGISFYNINS